MKFNDEEFALFKDNSLMRDFLDSCEGQYRSNITSISYICSELADMEDAECTAEMRSQLSQDILKNCRQMLKMLDIYAAITEAISTNDASKEKISIVNFLNTLVVECSKKLPERCRITYNPGSSAETDTIVRLLEFILILYIRNSAINGASAIDISHEIVQDNITIKIKGDKKRKTADSEMMLEKFSFDHAEGIMTAAAHRIGGKIEFDDASMTLEIPIENSDMVLKSPKNPYRSRRFNTYENLLSDVCDITNI